MKKMRKVRWGLPVLTGVATLLLVFAFALALEPFALVSHAESKAKVTATTAKIRKEPNTSSEILGSTEKDKEISIKSQTTGSDGSVWYQVYVNADTLGYIRSDLVSITDGTTPPTETAPTTNTGGNTGTETNPPAEETPVPVTAVQPISANATGGQSIRVRANASTTSAIVKTVKEGLALTVTGQATGTDGNTWYQVTYIDNGAEVTGFIRNDYVALSGELIPVTETPPADGGEEQPAEPQEPVVEKKDWDTQLQGDTWYLIDNVGQTQYSIQQIFDAAEKNAAAFTEEEKTVKTQKVVIIILVILVVALAAGVAFLVFKIKDSIDSNFFSQVEKETMRKRAERPQRAGGQKVMHTVGASKAADTPGQGRRPAGAPGQKPAGRPVQGQRPAGAPGQGTSDQSRRPAGQPGQRPAGAPGQGASDQSRRPAGQPGQRPAGAPGQGTSDQSRRPAGQPGQRPAGQPQGGQRPNAQNPGWKSKNFMSDDDEFEFEFLNWDGDEEQ